ncbi:hypothetical protein F4808DRAFT_474596 [Astrocystis sublimbata]|nr:hypothetical protein F4808DRAFT_474596 [Astrocystis sublimbata]
MFKGLRARQSKPKPVPPTPPPPAPEPELKTDDATKPKPAGSSAPKAAGSSAGKPAPKPAPNPAPKPVGSSSGKPEPRINEIRMAPVPPKTRPSWPAPRPRTTTPGPSRPLPPPTPLTLTPKPASSATPMDVDSTSSNRSKKGTSQKGVGTKGGLLGKKTQRATSTPQQQPPRPLLPPTPATLTPKPKAASPATPMDVDSSESNRSKKGASQNVAGKGGLLGKNTPRSNIAQQQQLLPTPPPSTPRPRPATPPPPPSGPPPGPTSSPTPLEVYNTQLYKDVTKWMASSDYIPLDINYDWRPFCTALIENHRAAPSLEISLPNAPSPPPSPPYDPVSDDERMKDYGQQFGRDDRPKKPNMQTSAHKRSRPRSDVIPGLQPPIPDRVDGDIEDEDEDEVLEMLAPDPGRDWKHVLYVPAWMDPEYREDVVVTPAGRRLTNTRHDALFNLRPALRIEDVVRRPTDYAQRFGIAEDRLDGRSRMSPTWSKTRNPFEHDYEGQIEKLTPEVRQVAVRLSQDRRLKNNMPSPMQGQEILPEVLDHLLEQDGRMGNVSLAAEIQKAAAEGHSLEQIIDRLVKTQPGTVEAHDRFLTHLQDDQDYQRIIMMGLTTDELFQNNIYTMANDVVMDLDQPIHALFDKPHWSTNMTRGRRKRAPRNVYSINGFRGEYNVHTNPTLWSALQPALRLVSKVLSTNPPHLEAIYNMCTRQPIPYDLLDSRNTSSQSPPELPTLSKYVSIDDIDLDKTFRDIRRLHERHHYDWKANVLRVLGETLVIEIDAARTLGDGYKIPENNDGDDNAGWTYGSTATHRYPIIKPGAKDTGRRFILLRIAADLMWPLLVPQYSQSEKMVCSWAIATTLLHEFAHAVSQAQELLTSEYYGKQAGQHAHVYYHLSKLNGVVFERDSSTHHFEPYYYSSPTAELGYELEHSLWGQAAGLIGGSKGRISRHHVDLPFVVSESTYPVLAPDQRRRRGIATPAIRFTRPVQLGYLAKLFTKQFWDEDFAAYGFEALKMRPDKAPRKYLLWGRRMIEEVADPALFGRERAAFLRAVPEILLNSRQYILGSYLKALRQEAAYDLQFKHWWVRMAEQWGDEILHPLEGNVEFMKEQLERAVALRRMYIDTTPEIAAAHYEAYRAAQDPSDPDILDMISWYADIGAQYNDMIRYGGGLMQQLLTVHNEMQDDVADLQRMAAYFMASRAPGEVLRLEFKGNYTVPGLLWVRTNTYRRHAGNFAADIRGMLNAWPQLHAWADKWEQWSARFLKLETDYRAVMAIVEDGTKPFAPPFDVEYKARFDRLPTGHWRGVSDVYKKMALREYARAHPAVRITVDDFLNTYNNKALQKETDINMPIGKLARKLGKTMDDVMSLDGGGGGSNNMFDFSPPAQQGSTGLMLPRPPPSQPGAATSSRPSTPTSPYRFGVPGAAENPGRRIQKPRSDASATQAYRGYVTNLLTKPDPRLTTGEVGKLFQAGLPQPIVDQLHLHQPSAFGPASEHQPAVFPNAYAERNVMTALNTHHQARQEHIRQRRTLRKEYVAPTLWREKMKPRAKKEDSDGDTDMTDVEMTDVDS